ncbi:hypothetical protein LT85_4813 [Collimonas arenae]|uniref:Uncharacterized protein n=1 Tax=Collimonas arenae TaxID=279058 RepID=A0A0A1FHA8_9BURK|nr:hypothetical protein LT85_4813 [Collimonas arenae]
MHKSTEAVKPLPKRIYGATAVVGAELREAIGDGDGRLQFLT